MGNNLVRFSKLLRFLNLKLENKLFRINNLKYCKTSKIWQPSSSLNIFKVFSIIPCPRPYFYTKLSQLNLKFKEDLNVVTKCQDLLGHIKNIKNGK